MATLKTSSIDLLWTAVNSFTISQCKIIAKAAKYNQVGEIIATLKFYCNKELEKRARIAAPKDTSDPVQLVFDPGEDCRIDKQKNKKISLWGFLSGA